MKNGIKINSIEGAEILKIQDGKIGQKKMNCVIANSLLLNKLRELKLDVSKIDSTKDIINVKFTYSYKGKDKGEIREELYENGFSLDFYKTVKKKEVFDKTIEYCFWFRTAGKAKNGEVYFINKMLWNKINTWQSMGIKLPPTDAKLVEFEVYKSLISSAIEDVIEIKPSEILVVSDLVCFSELQPVIKVIRDEITGISKAVHSKDKCKNTIWDGMALLQGGTGIKGLRHHFFKAGGFCCDFQQYFNTFYGDKYETATIMDRYERPVKVSTIKMITTENAMKWEKFIGNNKDAFEYWSRWVEENGCKFGICKTDHVSKYGNNQRMSYQMLNTLPISKKELESIFTTTNEFIKDLQNNDEKFIEHLRRTVNEVNNNELLVDLAINYPNFIRSYYFKDCRKTEINLYKDTLKQSKILAQGDNETIVGNPYLLLQYCVGLLDKYIKDGVISGYTDISLPNKNSCYCKRFEQGATIGAFRSPHNAMNNIMLFDNTYDKNIMDKYFKNLGSNVIVVNFLYNDIQDRGNGLDTDLDFAFCTDNKIIVDACIKAQEFPTIINKFEKSTKTYNNSMKDLARIDNLLQASQKSIGTSSNVAQLYLTKYWDRMNNHKDGEVTEKLLDNVCILSVLAQVAVDSSKRAFIVGNGDNGLNNEIDRLRKELRKSKIEYTDDIESDKFRNPTFWQYTSTSFKNDEIEKKLRNKDKKAWRELKEKDKKTKIKEEKENMINQLYNYSCPVNWVLEEVDKITKAEKTESLDNGLFINKEVADKNKEDRKQANKIEEVVEFLDYNVKFYNNSTLKEEDINEISMELWKDALEQINKLSIKIETMSLLISRALEEDNKFLKDNKQIRTKLLNTLYRYNKENFIKCFKNC